MLSIIVVFWKKSALLQFKFFIVSKISRKLTRRFLFQKLFALGYAYTTDDEFLDAFYFDDWESELDRQYFNEMQEIILSKEWTFIYIIKKYAPKFDIENMSILYVLPVFIALAEMFYLKEEIPAKVSLNEAIELAKIYSDDWIKKVVNWILNKAMEDYDKLSVDIKEIEKISDYCYFKKSL